MPYDDECHMVYATRQMLYGARHMMDVVGYMPYDGCHRLDVPRRQY